MQEFIELFLGEMTKAQWAFHLLLMWMGATLFILYRIRNRKRKDIPLSLNIWLSNWDNLFAFPIAFILSYILIRFYSNYQEAIVSYLPIGLKMTPYFAMVVIGFGQHKISEWLAKQALKS